MEQAVHAGVDGLVGGTAHHRVHLGDLFLDLAAVSSTHLDVYKRQEEKCADPAKARARALDALASREMSSAQLYERLCYGFTCLLYTSRCV